VLRRTTVARVPQCHLHPRARLITGRGTS
jgi:hypothetical protein